MNIVHVEFQEGWDGGQVEVSVNGGLCYQGTPTTRMQTGFADSFSAEVETDTIELGVSVPGLSLSVERSISVAKEHWIGLSLKDHSTIRVAEQPAPFGYL
ncbi:hypothetical protein [Arthrobacter cavernae]|uniref:Uncharacterized protein n=1 Tax=Arthrobacter cavernae TaxID=2817681 RepID=A0A939HEM6_9MICC|nr:hypothetical protein [Arthrobacter cavernae]MBO1269469.1 hypothetical protein [Arthrobacter cavernae]